VAKAQLSDENLKTATTNSEWILMVDGAVNQPLNLTLDDLNARSRKKVNSALYCMGSLVTSGDWVGIKFGYLLETAGIHSKAKTLTFITSDGYQIVLDLKNAFQDNVVIAYELDGHPLSEITRLVVPWKNGDSWIAWITHITVSTVSVSTPANNAYLPPQLSLPPSIPHSNDTLQPSNKPTDTLTDPLSSPEIDVKPTFTKPKPPEHYYFVPVTVIMVIVTATTAYLYLKRKK